MACNIDTMWRMGARERGKGSERERERKVAFRPGSTAYAWPIDEAGSGLNREDGRTRPNITFVKTNWTIDKTTSRDCCPGLKSN